MTGLTRHDRRRSACVGAFARYLLPRWPTLKLDVSYEPGVDRVDCTRTMAMLGLWTGTMINVTTEIPGQVGDNTKMVFEGGRWVRTTMPLPARLQHLLYTRDVDRPMVLDKLAQIALIRTQRMDAGEYGTLAQFELRPAEHYGDYKQLPPGPPAWATRTFPQATDAKLSDVKIYINGERAG